MATTWGPDDEPRAERRRVGLRASLALAAMLGAGGEATVRVVGEARAFAPMWNAARVPLLAALTLAVAQVPFGRAYREPPALSRPRRSELSRHLDRRARRDDA